MGDRKIERDPVQDARNAALMGQDLRTCDVQRLLDKFEPGASVHYRDSHVVIRQDTLKRMLEAMVQPGMASIPHLGRIK